MFLTMIATFLNASKISSINIYSYSILFATNTKYFGHIFITFSTIMQEIALRYIILHLIKTIMKFSISNDAFC